MVIKIRVVIYRNTKLNVLIRIPLRGHCDEKTRQAMYKEAHYLISILGKIKKKERRKISMYTTTK